MTTKEEMQERVLLALERFERQEMKPKRKKSWNMIRLNGVRVPMRKPKMDKVLRPWAEDAQCR